MPEQLEGIRRARWEGDTVTIYTEYPDGTAYVSATKTFPPGTLSLARHQWKVRNHAKTYGSSDFTGRADFTGNWGNQYTNHHAEPHMSGAMYDTVTTDDFDIFAKEVVEAVKEAQAKQAEQILNDAILWRKHGL